MAVDLATLAAAGLALGAGSSLHCVAMCGPLAACATRAAPRRALPVVGGGAAALSSSYGISMLSALASYQVARLAGYAVGGAGAGALGAGVSGAPWVASGLTWAMAAACAVAAVRPRAGSLGGVGRALGAIAGRYAGERGRGLVLGAATAVLPCGLLLSTYALASASGGAGRGAALLGAFALGSGVPLVGVQVGAAALRGRLSPRIAATAQRALLLVTALTLAWRGWGLAHGGASCHAP